MRISAKGRYALAAMIHMAQQYESGQQITVLSIADSLGISRIYLEQVFSLLRRADLVRSVKGAQGGYQLRQTPGQITAYGILAAVELSFVECAQDTVREKAPEIDAAMQLSVFGVLDSAIKTALEGVTLADLVGETERQKKDDAQMFYI